MSKIEMTLGIGQKIKEWRLKYNIKSKDLAKHINKSPAYISKVEKGDIKEIDTILLKEIISFINNENNAYETFLLSATEKISAEELDHYAWFLNYDTIDRLLPVPESLIKFINSKMSDLKITSEQLCKYINENEDLASDFFKNHNINKYDTPLNIWNAYRTVSIDGKPIKSSFILLNYEQKDIDLLLSSQMDKSNYTFLFAIIYHLFKYECKLNHNFEDLESCQLKTLDLLRSNKIYTLTDLKRISRQANTKAEYNELLNEFDQTNQNLINMLLKKISFISEYDVKYANDKLTNIVKNIEDDISFSLSFMALSIERLKDANFDLKKEFLDQVDNLINLYLEKMQNDNIQRY
jgi:transcriptional regulator with XRE-family HTH domain